MSGNFYKKGFLSGAVLSALLGVACVMSLFHLRQALSSLETPAIEDITQGKWPHQFETSFRECLPVNTISRNVWGTTEYALFHQGRKGVVVGAGGWLFTDEEFSCPPQYRQNLADNLAFISSVQKTLARKNARLAIVLVPAKARVFPAHLGGNILPSCRNALYTDIRSFLVKNSLAVTDLLPAMQFTATRDDLYLKTDTHWSPSGAQLAAQLAAELVHTSFNDLELPVSTFSSQAGGIKNLDGDLTNYMPGVALPPDHITAYVSGVSVASTDMKQDILGDEAPPVTLVGTSYSANPNWNFEGFLKESLKADILNMADQGLGPFVVMDKYLTNDAWKNTPPRLVIWEMPERYFLMPHGMTALVKK